MDITSYCNFRPSTSGELLFHYIIKEVIGRKRISEFHTLSLLQIGGRFDGFFEYYTGVFAANLMARCIKKAKRISSDFENEKDHQRLLVRYFQDSLEIPRDAIGGDLDRFAFLTLEAEKKSRKDIIPSIRKLFSSTGPTSCYICGRMIYEKATDDNEKVELEHIWPQSFGGDSIAENLLPSCKSCNKDKAHMLLWQNSNVHSFVLKPMPSAEEFTAIRRIEKIAKHRWHIFDHACKNKSTLKNAALQIGPAALSDVKSIDSDDAVDFFNFDFAQEM